MLAKTCNFCHQCASSIIRDRIILGIRQSETRQELLKIRKLSLDACVDVCRAAESAISHRSVLGDVCEPVHVVNHGRLLKRECQCCGRRHAPKKEMCTAYGKICNNCRAKDHFEQEMHERAQHKSVVKKPAPTTCVQTTYVTTMGLMKTTTVVTPGCIH